MWWKIREKVHFPSLTLPAHICLQRSLPALRQMTPDSEAFIQQSLLPQPSTQPAAAPTALTAVVLRPPLSTAATTTTSTSATKTTVISLTQTPHSKPGLVSKGMDDYLEPINMHFAEEALIFGLFMILHIQIVVLECAQIVPQQHGTMIRPQATLTQSPMVTLRGQPHNRIIVSQPQVVKQLHTGVCSTTYTWTSITEIVLEFFTVNVKFYYFLYLLNQANVQWEYLNKQMLH